MVGYSVSYSSRSLLLSPSLGRYIKLSVPCPSILIICKSPPKNLHDRTAESQQRVISYYSAAYYTIILLLAVYLA